MDKMNYRPEIDGLRAIAVLPVVLFHAGFSVFSGGYVGVDIFFVISGYLITTILLTEMEQDKFSLVNFYERRARRILPALFFVMFTSTVAAFFFLSPSHMQDFSQSLVAISLFSSNILFWQETGYWGVENELKPLLHTWSLAVEEQYYILFPLFLMLMWKFRKRWIFSSFVFIALISFLFSQYLSNVAPTANFFLLPTRGWELAIGSVIAFYFLYRPKEISTLLSNKYVEELMGFLGIALILYSIFVYDEITPFPSMYALLPTVGTALVIVFANRETLVGQVLSSKLLVGIGLLSYSAYLWHQPLFAFSRHISLIHPSKLTFIILSVFSFILAAITLKYIEAPFRNKAAVSRGQVFKFSVAGSLLFIIIGLFVSYKGGLPHRFSDELDRINKINNETLTANLKESFSKEMFETSLGKLAISVIGDGSPNSASFIVWGDSHAAMMLPAVHESAKNNQVKGIAIGRGGCLPLVEAAQILPRYYDSCLQHNEKVVEYIANHPNLKRVILISRWSIYAVGERFEREFGHTVFIKDYLTTNISIDENKKVFNRSVARTLVKLREMGLEITIVRQVPETEFNIPDAYSKTLMFNYEFDLEPDFSAYLKRNKFVNDTFDGMREEYSLSFVNPHEVICNSEKCSVLNSDGIPIYRDTNHLQYFYAKQLSHIFDPVVKPRR
jgi:peptidoglycan/LPS O-acetylase OafA/YrhL